MKRIRFSEVQIIAVLREHEAGAKAADLARKLVRQLVALQRARRKMHREHRPLRINHRCGRT
jgi:hypothetical protein